MTLRSIDQIRKIQASAEQTMIITHLNPEYLFCQKCLIIHSRERSVFGVYEENGFQKI